MLEEYKHGRMEGEIDFSYLVDLFCIVFWVGLSSFLSCLVMSCHVLSCHVMSCHVMSCLQLSCYVAAAQSPFRNPHNQPKVTAEELDGRVMRAPVVFNTRLSETECSFISELLQRDVTRRLGCGSMEVFCDDTDRIRVTNQHTRPHTPTSNKKR